MPKIKLDRRNRPKESENAGMPKRKVRKKLSRPIFFYRTKFRKKEVKIPAQNFFFSNCQTMFFDHFWQIFVVDPVCQNYTLG